jgi:hypothetical protein
MIVAGSAHPESIVDPSQPYAVQLGLNLLQFAVAVAIVLGAYRLVRRWLSAAHGARAFRYVLLTLVYVFVAALVLQSFMTLWGFRGETSPFGFQRMLDHTAERPYVYRVLSPEIIKAGAALLPEGLVSERQDFLLEHSPLLQYRRPGERWSLEKSTRWHVAYFYLFACLIGVLFAARALTARACDVSPLFADFAPVVALLCLPVTFHFGGYMYDFPELLLLLLCLLMIVTGRLAWYYPLYLLAILNKESNVLIPAFFLAFLWDRMPRRSLVIHLGVQLLVGWSLVLALRFAFLENTGSQALFVLPLNLLFWTSPEAYWQFITPYAPLISVPRGANLITLFVVGFVLIWRWSEKPAAFRRLVLLSAVCTLPLFVFFSFLDEIRALSIMFPGIYLMACFTVNDVYGRVAG